MKYRASGALAEPGALVEVPDDAIAVNTSRIVTNKGNRIGITYLEPVEEEENDA